jgi:hypothetical protein
MDYLRYRGGTPWSKEHDPYGNIELLDAAMGVGVATAARATALELRATALEALPVFVHANMADTMSREENIAGLASAIVLANALKVTLNAHAADAVEHGTAADAVNFPVATANATNLATLLALSGSLLTAYAAHNADAMLGAAWAFHNAQVNANALVSAVTPVTLEEAVTRLNDLKAKYNAHEGSAVSHTAGSAHTEGAANAAYGNTNRVPIATVLGTDSIWIDLVDGGVGVVTLTTATMGAGFVDIQFSADPQNSAIVRYAIFRT